MEHIAASCVGSAITAVVSKCIGYCQHTKQTATPLDVVKTRLQAQTHVTDGKILSPAKQSLHFFGTFDALFKISQNEGVRNLWRGLGPSLAMIIPVNTMYVLPIPSQRLKIRYFALYEEFKKDFEALGPLTPLVAGITSRTISVTAFSPIDLLRTNVQSHSKEVIFKELLTEYWKSGNVTARLWSGYIPTLWRDVPFSGIYWTGVEFVRYEMKERYEAKGFYVNFLAGFLSGMVAAALTVPFDVIKTRIQMDAHRLDVSFTLEASNSLTSRWNRSIAPFIKSH